MSEDIVALLRILNHHAKKLAENESLHDLHREAFTRCEDLTGKAERDIVQLRQQVADLSAERDIVQLRQRVAELRAERDEARRMVCGLDADIMEDQIEYAKHRGWDCFKEQT